MNDDRPLTAFEITKHPLVVVVATTLLGSVLFPIANGWIARSNRIHELKVSHALQALHSSHTTDSQLNLLLTEFNNFVKDENVSDSTSRAAFVIRAKRLYADFDRDAWWWYWQLLQEAQLLGLIDDGGVGRMRAAIEEYSSNLKEFSVGIGPIWSALTSPSALLGRDELLEILASSNTKAAQLQQRLTDIVTQMIRPLLD